MMKQSTVVLAGSLLDYLARIQVEIAHRTS